MAEAVRRIEKTNQPLSNNPPRRSGHPRGRATLRGKKGTWILLSSRKPKTRGSRWVRGGVEGYRGCPVLRQPFILPGFHLHRILRYCPNCREEVFSETWGTVLRVRWLSNPRSKPC